MQKLNVIFFSNFFKNKNYSFKILNCCYYSQLNVQKSNSSLFEEDILKKKSLTYLKRVKKTKLSFFQLILNIKKQLNTLKFNFIFAINLLQNNIFSFLLSLPRKKIIFFKTASNYGIKITKKLLKRNCFVFLKPLILLLYKYVKDRHIIIILSSPKRLRKKILKYLNLRLKVFVKLLCINTSYCFNGCRAKKIRRKKRKGLRIFK